MSEANFQVLTTESVAKLRRGVLAKPDLVEQSLEDLVSSYSLTYAPTSYCLNRQEKILLPQGFSQGQNNDTENCGRVLNLLPGLSPAQATDERLWVTLAFGDCAEYMRARWPFRMSVEDKLSRHVLNHWFASGVRGRMRDNGISRLWWMGYVAERVPGMTSSEVHEILFANSDYRSTLLERSSTTNSMPVLAAILAVSKAAFESGMPYDRAVFREFMKHVNIMGGRRNLAAMDTSMLVAIFSPIYKKVFEKQSELNR